MKLLHVNRRTNRTIVEPQDIHMIPPLASIEVPIADRTLHTPTGPHPHNTTVELFELREYSNDAQIEDDVEYRILVRSSTWANFKPAVLEYKAAKPKAKLIPFFLGGKV
jgi:hypothetical protein